MEHNPFSQKPEPVESKKNQNIEHLQISEQVKNIQEVFTFNPELKNKVEEAICLDSDYRDIMIDLGRNKDSESLGKIQNINVYYKDNLVVDSDNSVVNKSNNKLFLVTKTDGLSYVGDINLPEELRNKGLGLKILQKISNTLNTKIIPTYLSTGGFTSDHAKNMWSKVNNEIHPNHDTEKFYAEYLKTIFPESKVKDILWHGTISEDKIKEFNHNFEFNKKEVTYLGYLNQAVGYKDSDRGDIYATVVNIKNPYIQKPLPEDAWATDQLQKEHLDSFKNAGYDSIIGDGLFGDKETIIFTPEQIHILGSVADIEKFKEFASNMVR